MANWEFLSTEGFQPHGMCLLWRPDIFWAHLGADFVIALSYFSIPLAIVYVAYRRPDVEHGWLLYLFGGFIVACGITHVFGIWTMFVPDYGIEAVLKLATAVISSATAVALWPLMPRILAVPSPRMLAQQNLRLAQEIHERMAAERRLADLNDELERRVRERTASLQRANQELKEARSRAESANRSKSDFLAAMSHEIRTPMNGVLGMLELMRGEGLKPEAARYLEIAHDSAHGLLRVIDDVLDLSRLDAHALELETTEFSPGDEVRKVIELLAEGGAKKGVALVAEIDAAMPATVAGDPTRLRQILFNLVGNAIKFTEAGEVRILAGGCPLEDGRLELHFEVRDSGIGIAPEALERLFHRFVQADGSTARRYGGSGLGLAISRELVELMGGEIGVESTLGEGSRFRFSVCCARSVPEAPRPAAPERPSFVPANSAPARILVVEDYAVNALLVCRLLAKGGHAARVASDAREAMAQLEQETYDLVLMDVHLPGMDGVTATRMIRSGGGRQAEIPIVAVTANAMAGDRDACLAAGMDDYLSKPIDATALFATIGRLLRRRGRPARAGAA